MGKRSVRFGVMFMIHIASQRELDRSIEFVFQECFSFGVWDVFVLFQSSGNKALIQSVTWFPYHESNCAERVNKPVIMDECFAILEEDFIDIGFISYNNSLFPKIPETFHDCPLRVTVVNEPFVFDYNFTGKRGAEYTLIENLADKLEMKPEFTVLSHTFALKTISGDPKSGFYADLLKG